MKKTIDFDDFTVEFANMSRSDNFSYDGLKALFNHLCEMEQSGFGYEIELDVIALCCEYTEYDNLRALQEDYDNIKSFEDLEDSTTVIMIDEVSFIIQNF